MRFLVIFTNGKEVRIQAGNIKEFFDRLEEFLHAYGPFDLIYTLDSRR